MLKFDWRHSDLSSYFAIMYYNGFKNVFKQHWTIFFYESYKLIHVIRVNLLTVN